MTKPGTHRPWRLEESDVGGDHENWTIVSDFKTEANAQKRLNKLALEKPELFFRVRKHVEFEAES
jgi:hypothetical protein